MTRTSARPPIQAGYPMLGSHGSRAQWLARLTALGIGICLIYPLYLYLHSDDIAPDSAWGYGFAICGTALLILVGVSYSVRKRLNRHAPIRLHTMLAWHAVGGVVGVLLIVLHSAGNFNARSGTYALYGLLAVALSGIIGRLIDRLCPRLATAAAAQAMTEAGEDRLYALEQKLEAAQQLQHARRRARRPRKANMPWDLAYHTLDPENDAIPGLLTHETMSGTGFVPTRAWRYVGSHTAQLLPHQRPFADYLHQQTTLTRAAMGREQFYLHMVRVWRRVHVLLCVAALGLLIWHLTYAAMLLLDAR
ncbi:MAG: hypothetical protein OJF49_003862 [Ktedonobacterales bacterium]|nr:MAG: hypothetical protein OJF49_003862 [Ktedonobacterales bacterium]